MPLTDSAVRNAKASPEGKDMKLADGGGMYLLVKSNGAKYWRLDYRYLDKRKTIALGVYPITSLKDARETREEAKRLLAQGIDPSVHRQQSKLVSRELAANSFEVVAREWMAKQQAAWSPSYAVKIQSSFERDVFPFIGSRPIASLSAPELLAVLRKIVDRGAVERVS